MPESARVATINSLLQIEALSNPVRVRILRHANRPITVAGLADRLGVPKTRLYHHVNLLVEADVLRQVDERRSGARTEKIDLRTAERFRLGSGTAEAIGDRRKAAEAAAIVLFDPARAEVADFLEHILGREQPPAHPGRTVVRLRSEAAEDFANRLGELLDELPSDLSESDLEDDEEGITYAMTAAFVPVDLLEESR